ncbi:MAG: response regulator [Deltaproteobacteria bacterium]|jgi:DNA-binding response OmpR family regulator|nr:response regulator [Deltaproteobacteria bacterium]
MHSNTANTPAPAILIVDDDELIHKLLGAILHKAGFRCLDALCGEEGLEMARRERPDLIILDVMMPGLNGFDVMRALKSDPGTSTIPVVFLSGKFHNREKTQARELGAADFMEKPFERTELLARVRTYLTLRRQEDNLSFYNDRIVQMAKEALGLLSPDRSGRLETLPEELAESLDSSYREARDAVRVMENQWVVFSAFVKPYLAGQADTYYRESLALIPDTLSRLKTHVEHIGSVSRELRAVAGRAPSPARPEAPAPEAPPARAETPAPTGSEVRADDARTPAADSPASPKQAAGDGKTTDPGGGERRDRGAPAPPLDGA